MTNTNKTLLCCLVGLTTMAVLVSCGKDDGSPAPVASTPITVTADWNRIALEAWTQLEANAGAQITPHYEARGLAMSSGVIHDVLNAIDHRYAAYAYVATQPGASPDAAVAQAAHDVMVANTQLVSDYPAASQKAFLDAALATDLAKVPDGPAKTSGIALGQAAATFYIQLRASDAPHMAAFGPNPRGLPSSLATTSTPRRSTRPAHRSTAARSACPTGRTWRRSSSARRRSSYHRVRTR